MPTPFRIRLSSVLPALVLCALAAVPALGESQARIVRLSDVQGSVQINKNTGLGFENAFLNLPVTQGTQLRTSSNGRAEIEFEDGSSMRLAPSTTVEFSRLGVDDSGKRTSQVHLLEGMAYVNWLGKDDFSLEFSREVVSLDHAAHFRVDSTPEVATLAVFKGDVPVEGPAGKISVDKKKTATFDPSADDKSTVANKIAEEPLDSWDKQSVDYHSQYAKNNSTPYGYGYSDLNYYGAFSTIPGYGLMWQPYFTGIGWDPFMDGAWSFYPGFGYMFASAYPWGWMPYYYGNWAFVPGFGWGWQPGGWNNFHPVPHFTPTTAVHMTALVPPTSGTIKTVAVGKGGAASPSFSPARLTVSNGSAGLGIARGSIDNMRSLNHQVTKSGFAEVHAAPQFGGRSESRGVAMGESRGGMSSGASMGHASAGGHSGGGGSHK